mmetsp:Transcript_21049/g.60135  ORF Transcript_21049/g.60135 Transcript_21049/m.60135 type:complete len:228 (-) Transcript_21049:1020-1703(-)
MTSTPTPDGNMASLFVVAASPSGVRGDGACSEGCRWSMLPSICREIDANKRRHSSGSKMSSFRRGTSPVADLKPRTPVESEFTSSSIGSGGSTESPRGPSGGRRGNSSKRGSAMAEPPAIPVAAPMPASPSASAAAPPPGELALAVSAAFLCAPLPSSGTRAGRGRPRGVESGGWGKASSRSPTAARKTSSSVTVGSGASNISFTLMLLTARSHSSFSSLVRAQKRC